MKREPGSTALAERPTNDQVRALVEEHGVVMYRVAIAVVRDSALAEDVVQETLIKVWANLPGFRGDAPIRPWILRITHNTAVSALRRIKDEAWDPSWLPEGETRGGVEETAIARDEIVRLREALTEIDELSRSILALRELEGMSYDAIADTLGISLGQVKIRLLRARRKLQSMVRGAEP